MAHGVRSIEITLIFNRWEPSTAVQPESTGQESITSQMKSINQLRYRNCVSQYMGKTEELSLSVRAERTEYLGYILLTAWEAKGKDERGEEWPLSGLASTPSNTRFFESILHQHLRRIRPGGNCYFVESRRPKCVLAYRSISRIRPCVQNAKICKRSNPYLRKNAKNHVSTCVRWYRSVRNVYLRLSQIRTCVLKHIEKTK